VAYIGDAPPLLDHEDAQLASPRVLRGDGVELRVTLDNQLRTYDTQVYLYALPLGVDGRRVYDRNFRPGKTRISLQIKVLQPGFVLRPAQAALSFGGMRWTASEADEFAMRAADGSRVDAGGRWGSQRIENELALTEIGRNYIVSIYFDTPVPSPEAKDITVDLSTALSAPSRAPMPLIRFMPSRWKEGYT
jgi:hypothetical protein